MKDPVRRRNALLRKLEQCSEFVRGDCSRWLGEVDAALPSLVLAARRTGRDIVDVQVLLDGEPLVDRIDGKAVPVDPGMHSLKFIHQGAEPVVIDLVIRQGEKNRLVTAEFATKPDEPETPGRPPATPPPVMTTTADGTGRGWLPYALGGLGVLGIAGFVTLGAWGNQEKAERETTCAPECSQSAISSVRTKYYLADGALGVGILALGAAAYVYWIAPSKTRVPSDQGNNTSFEIRLTPAAGFASIRTRL